MKLTIFTFVTFLLSCSVVKAQPSTLRVDSFYLEVNIQDKILPFFSQCLYNIPWQENGEYLLLLENEEGKGVVNVGIVIYDGSPEDGKSIHKGTHLLKELDFSSSKYLVGRKVYLVPIITYVGDPKEFVMSERFQKFVSLQEAYYGDTCFTWPVLKSYYYNPLIHK